VIFASVVFAPTLLSQTPSTDLELGIRAHESGQYPEAVEHLERAVLLDPSSVDGHYYLASAYAWMCPDENPQDGPTCDSAMREYNKVLEISPNHKEGLKSLGYLLYHMARQDEAEALYRRAAHVDENDPQALYSIAVIVFRRTYPAVNSEKLRHKLKPEQPLIDLADCPQVRDKYLPDVEEGISLLTRAAGLLENIDVQGYLGAYYSERADLQCSDRAAYNRDRVSSKLWWDKACRTFHNPKRSFPPRWFPSPGPPPPKPGDTCKWW
jgi:tetratricopeptide (TPR) repeat protein